MNVSAPGHWLALTFASCLALLSVQGETPVPAAPPAQLGSTIFKFEDLAVKPSGVGERRDVADQPTATLTRFECHISTLNPSRASHPPHTHPQEELIILRDGTLDVNVNGQIQRVGPGSLFFFASNNPHAVQNNGEKPATYFVFNFATAATRTPPAIGAASVPGQLGSTVVEWTKLPVQATKTGERRAVIDSPTATLANFECHVTTLNPGEAAHAPHRHPDEEIIFVREGQVEVSLNGHAQSVGSGAVLFFASNDEHGLKNVGSGAATYYVMRLKTEATPASVAMK